VSTGLPGTSLVSLSDSASSGIGGGANAARVEVENNSLRAVVIAGKLAIQACAKTPACSTALEEEGLGALLGIGAAKTVMDNLSSSEQMSVFSVAMNGGRADLLENLTPEQRAAYDYIVEQDKKGPFHLLPAQQRLNDGIRGPGHTELPIADQDPTGGKLVNPDRSGEQGATHTGSDQPIEQGATNTGNLDGSPDTGGNTTVTPVPDGPDKDDLAYLAGNYEPNKNSVGNMGEFLKQPGFGSTVKDNTQKTNQQYQGQTIYKATDNIGDYIKKGDQFYLDGLHKDHIEVFDKRGNFKAVVNLDGTINKAKTDAALGRELK